MYTVIAPNRGLTAASGSSARPLLDPRRPAGRARASR